MKKLILAMLLSLACIDAQAAATPVDHVVVIFQENVSFDHYFATYPVAANAPGEPPFHALRNTPAVNGLPPGLRSHNPNSANPFRLKRSQAMTCDMEHEYRAEQLAFDAGLMDRFVEYTAATGKSCDPKDVMGYYDGNTVTALWNYAQHFAMSDNFYGTTFGPSTPGALNLVSGRRMVQRHPTWTVPPAMAPSMAISIPLTMTVRMAGRYRCRAKISVIC